MEPVISVNLNGNAYHFEEAGHTKLRVYLERAKAALEGNPDQAEILADLEQAVADKCQRVLGPHKTVVTAAEVEQVLEEMGPVDNASEDADGPSTSSSTSSAASDAGTKHLYQIREGAMISGLCQGIAAYFNVDVIIVRVLFVVLALLTKGLWLLVYGVLMFVIPYAKTSEEHAAAHGMPFNAKEVIDQAKRNYAHFRSGRDWRRQWKRQRRVWKQHVHRRMWEQSYLWNQEPGPWPHASGPPLIMPILNLLSAAWILGLLLALISLIATGAIFGWAIPAGIPVWVAALALIVVYQFIAAPLVMARAWRHSGHGVVVQSNGLVSLLALLILGWLAYQYVPAFHVLVQRALAYLQTIKLPN